MYTSTPSVPLTLPSSALSCDPRQVKKKTNETHHASGVHTIILTRGQHAIDKWNTRKTNLMLIVRLIARSRIRHETAVILHFRRLAFKSPKNHHRLPAASGSSRRGISPVRFDHPPPHRHYHRQIPIVSLVPSCLPCHHHQ